MGEVYLGEEWAEICPGAVAEALEPDLLDARTASEDVSQVLSSSSRLSRGSQVEREGLDAIAVDDSDLEGVGKEAELVSAGEEDVPTEFSLRCRSPAHADEGQEAESFPRGGRRVPSGPGCAEDDGQELVR